MVLINKKEGVMFKNILTVFTITFVTMLCGIFAHASYSNVPTYTFESTFQDETMTATQLAACKTDLKKQLDLLQAKRVKIISVQSCGLKTIGGGDQSPASYNVAGSILFL